MKTKKSIIVFLAVLMTFALTFAACGGGGGGDQAPPADTPKEDSGAQATEPAPAAGGGDNGKIAALNPWVNTPYQPAFIEYGRQVVEAAGYEYVLLDGESDGEKQYDQAKQCIDEGYAGILLSPNDGASGAKIAQLCKDAGVPLLTATSEVDVAARDLVTIRVGVSGDYQGDELGKMLVAKAGELGGDEVNVVSITGTPSLEAIQGRSNGFKAAIAADPNINLLAEQSADFDKAKAMEIMENYLTTYPKIDAVYCHDDTMAVGAIEALKAAGKAPGEVIVIGVGGNIEGLQAVRDGWMYCTMMQAPDVEGALQAECLIKYLNGDAIDYTEGNYVLLPSPIVTIDNADDYDAKW